MKAQTEIQSAYKTFIEAAVKIPEQEFTRADMNRIEGALDALNWVMNDDELASVFETTLKGLRNRLARLTPGEETQ